MPEPVKGERIRGRRTIPRGIPCPRCTSRSTTRTTYSTTADNWECGFCGYRWERWLVVPPEDDAGWQPEPRRIDSAGG